MIEQAWLSRQELATKSGLSLATIDRRRKDGTLPFVQLGGRRCRILFSSDVLRSLVVGTPSANEPVSIDPVPPAEPLTQVCETKDQPSGPRPRWQAFHKTLTRKD